MKRTVSPHDGRVFLGTGLVVSCLVSLFAFQSGCGTGVTPQTLTEQFLSEGSFPVPTPTTDTTPDAPDVDPVIVTPTPQETFPSPVPEPSPTPTYSPGAQKGVCGELYDISKLAHDRLPDFAHIKSVGRIVLDNFAIDKRSYLDRIPGVPKGMTEWYALEFEGWITVAKHGEIGFSLRSDDGSKLFIDEELVINRDGVQSMSNPTTNRIELPAGKHHFKLQYFQGPKKYVGLRFAWQLPGKKWEAVPVNALEGFGYNDHHCF